MRIAPNSYSYGLPISCTSSQGQPGHDPITFMEEAWSRQGEWGKEGKRQKRKTGYICRLHYSIYNNRYRFYISITYTPFVSNFVAMAIGIGRGGILFYFLLNYFLYFFKVRICYNIITPRSSDINFVSHWLWWKTTLSHFWSLWCHHITRKAAL